MDDASLSSQLASTEDTSFHVLGNYVFLVLPVIAFLQRFAKVSRILGAVIFLLLRGRKWRSK